jgi:hypothetical protein
MVFLVTPSIRIPCEKLIVAEVVKKTPISED